MSRSRPWFLYRRHSGWAVFRRDANWTYRPVRWQGWLVLLAIAALIAGFLYARIAAPRLTEDPTVLGASAFGLFVLVLLTAVNARNEHDAGNGGDLRDS